MKSMSWLLYENESSILRECRACGFSTRSPSIYRRHSRHCTLQSLQQPNNGTIPARDFPNVSAELSSDFPSVLPPADFPEVRCSHPMGFFNISSPPLVSDKLLVAEAILDPGTDKTAVVSPEESTFSESLDTSGISVKTLTHEVSQSLKEFTSDSVSSASVSLPVNGNLAPVSVLSLSADCCTNIPPTPPMNNRCDPDDKSSVRKENDWSDVLIGNSHSDNPVDCSTEDIGDEMKVVNEVADCSEAERKSDLVTDLPSAENVVTMDDSCMDSSPESTCGEIHALSKKSSRSRKRSSPSKLRRCKHCKFVLSNRLERRTHMQAKHPDKIPVFRCTDCNYCSTEHKNYERHLLRHLLAGPFRCDKCSFSSTSQSSIKRHVALQHNSQSDTSTNNVTGSAEILSPVSEFPPTVVDGLRSENLSSPSDQIADADLLPVNSEKPKTLNNGDGVPSTKHSHGNNVLAGNSETNADFDGETSEEAAVPDGNKDVIQSVIEVEVKNCPGEESGEDETWWTCLACGARYNERAKVRRHVKCKHRIPLTECRLHDLRTTMLTLSTSNTSSPANDLIQKLEEARSAGKAQAFTSSSESLATSAQSSVTTKTGCSIVSSGVKLQPKSFVKIAPKPLPIDSSCQIIAAASAGIVSSKRQVVLPKRNWKQMSVSLQPAKSLTESLSAVKDSDGGRTCDTSAVKDTDAGRTCDSGSELRSLTATEDKLDDEQKICAATAMQQATRTEAENDLGFSSIPVTLDVPKKKRRLILRAKATKMLPEPCGSVVIESTDSVKETDINPACPNVLPLEPSYNVDDKEHCIGMDDVTCEEPLNKESGNEQLKKTPTMKRQFGLKRTSPLKCAHCRFTAFRLPDLRRHLLEHTGDKVYECEKCSRSFRNRIGLYLHEQRKHKVPITQLSDVSQTDENAQTDMDMERSSAETQKTDVNKPKSKKKNIRNISSDSELKQNLDTQAAAGGETSTGGEEGMIKSVSAVVDEKKKKKERSSGKRCTETVEMVQPSGKSDHFKIVIRRQSSVGEEILETIAGVNNGMICKFCGYIAKIPVQLTQHMKIHTGERDYWCVISDCTYRTIWRCDMKRHLKKFHLDEVERLFGGNYYELLQSSYQPGKMKDEPSSGLSAENSSETVNVLKMSKRQRRRLLKLQNREHSKLTTKETLLKSESQEGATSVSASDVERVTVEPPSTAASEAKKDNVATKSIERFRPYKCSECGRRSNWRWDLKKHILAMHKKNAVIIKLNDDVARATFADIYTSHGGRSGIRFPRQHGSAGISLLARSKAGSRPSTNVTAGNPQAEESDANGKQPVSELERTLSRASTAVKSIGMIDMLRLKRFQCSGCPYRSNHRGDLGRHIRMRHGRGNCTVSVLSADVAAATLHAYRLQWNRKKAWLPKTETGKVENVKTRQKFRHSSRSAEVEEMADRVSEVADDAENAATESDHVGNGGSRKQNYKDFWYLDDGNDETKCCDICPFKTDRTGLLELHKLRHRAPAVGTSSISVTFSCPHCPYFVWTSRQLERHLALHEDLMQQSHHDLLPDANGLQHISRCGPAKNRYVCEKCPFSSMFRNEFWLHRRLHFVPRVDVPYSCDLCPFWVSDRRTMSEHSALHAQSYYPRLLVPVVSRYRPAIVQNSTNVAASENHSEEVTVVNDDAQPELVTKIFDDMQSKKIIGADDDMEVEACPHLEAVEQLVAAVSEAEVPDSCPLLEPECEPSPSKHSKSITCSALCIETLVLTPLSNTAGNLMTSDSGELPLNANNASDSDNKVSITDQTESVDLNTNTTIISSTLPVELSTSAPPSSEGVGVVMSGDNDVLLSDCNNVSEETVSATDSSETASMKSHLQPPDFCPRLHAESPISTIFPGAVGNPVTSTDGDVSVKNNEDVSDDRMQQVDCSSNVRPDVKADVSSCHSPYFTSAEENNRTHVMQVVASPEDNTEDSEDTDHTANTGVSYHQISDAVVSSSMDTGERCNDDALPEVNVDASDDRRQAGGNCEDEEMHAKTQISNRQIPDASSVGENNGKVESIIAGGSWNDGTCTCALQCPYCFFSIASVRLLRQHIVFHVAISDATHAPVFHPQLDGVEDGRMDDLRCAHLVWLCNGCRHLADLGNTDAIFAPETSRSFAVSGSCELGNIDQITLSELDDKAAFLSQLSLDVS